jgi:hypothetical protein
VPCLSHGIENLVQDRFTTLGTFGGIFVFIAGFAPGILVADDEGCSRSKGLPLLNPQNKIVSGQEGDIHRRIQHKKSGLPLVCRGICDGTRMVFIPQGGDDFILNWSIAMLTSRREKFMIIQMAIYLALILIERDVFL